MQNRKSCATAQEIFYVEAPGKDFSTLLNNKQQVWLVTDIARFGCLVTWIMLLWICDVNCSLCFLRELMPARCQNVFGRLESQSTCGLIGEKKVVTYIHGGLHLLVECLFQRPSNFFQKCSDYRVATLPKQFLESAACIFHGLFWTRERVGCRPHLVTSDHTVVPSVSGGLFSFCCHQYPIVCWTHLIIGLDVCVRHLHLRYSNYKQLPFVCPATIPATAAVYQGMGMPKSCSTCQLFL